MHISALCERFVKDPREVVKTGDIVRVKVMEVDLPRKRIALSMRLGDAASSPAGKPAQRPQEGAPRRREAKVNQPAPDNAFAAAFARAKQK